MILKNPTNAELAIKFNGIEYTLPGYDQKEFPNEVAVYWRTKLHQFLEVVKEPKAKVTEVKVPEVIVEVVKIPEVEIKPAKEVAKVEPAPKK